MRTYNIYQRLSSFTCISGLFTRFSPAFRTHLFFLWFCGLDILNRYPWRILLIAAKLTLIFLATQQNFHIQCSGYLSLIVVATLQFPFLSSSSLHKRLWFSWPNGSALFDCHVNLHTIILDCLAPDCCGNIAQVWLIFFAFCTFFLISARRFFCQPTTVFSTCVIVNLELISWLLTYPHKNQGNLLDDENKNKDAESTINTSETTLTGES